MLGFPWCPNRVPSRRYRWGRGIQSILSQLIGYLFATIIFAVLMVFRLGYRSWRWLGITIAVSFVSVLFFRTMLQIKTPVNIWLYNQLPDGLERFMKVYF